MGILAAFLNRYQKFLMGLSSHIEATRLMAYLMFFHTSSMFFHTSFLEKDQKTNHII